MATYAEIRMAINKYVEYYGFWNIGITDNPARTREAFGNPEVWHQWQANNDTAAREVLSYYTAKGMKEAENQVNVVSPYVFIFM
jgi:hypothetical protein